MCISGSLSQNIEVSQIPEVNAIEGSTANLECSYNLSNLDLCIGRYKWYRHVLKGVDIFLSDDFKDRITKESTEDFLNKTSASIQLHRVTVTDTGMYFCEVVCPAQTQIEGHGNGTFLIVEGSLSQNIEVSQIPEVNAIEGGTANLECSYNLSNLNLSNGWYKWYRHDLHGVDIFLNDGFKVRITKESPEDFLKKRSASIQLHRVTVTDTGMYFCEVEFSGQMQIKGHGNGTFLNVTATATDSTSWGCFTLYHRIGAVALGLLMSFALYLNCKEHKQVIREEEIICAYKKQANMDPTDCTEQIVYSTV
uniref:Natural cytotoxicity triggering receptor 3 n=1 Tax=Xenopus tropicalis TaxID=8364 RepID=A0A803JGU9_XENTR